jgi:ABC-type antimicrobial peptide transport system permease subunit
LKARGFVGDAARRLKSNPAAVVAFYLMSAIIALALLAPWINPNSAETLD